MKNDTKRSRLPLAAGLILFAAAALWALTRSFGCGADSIPGATNEQRIAYIESFGWDPGFTHTAVENVRIPVEFDDVYERNTTRSSANRASTCGSTARTPSSATPTSFPVIRRVPLNAELLVENGAIIGADIVSPAAGGFQGALAIDEN